MGSCRWPVPPAGPPLPAWPSPEVRVRSNVTALLVASGSGDQAALDQLTPLVRAELQRLAGQHMGGEHAGHSLKDDRKHEGPVAGLTVRGLSDAGHDVPPKPR